MKKYFCRSLFLPLLIVFALVACSKDEEEAVVAPGISHQMFDDYIEQRDGVTVTSDETLTINEVIGKVAEGGMFGEYAELVDPLISILKKQLNDTLAAWNSRYGFAATGLKVRCVKYSYRSIDHRGNPVTLSSYATWAYPDIENAQQAVVHDRIILFCPYSQTKEANCATATYGGAANVLIAKNALIVSPDPQGFGANGGNDQMYMNHELIGIQMADAMAAAYKVFLDLGFQLKEHFSLIPMGMSQGAATAVATQRYLENQPLTLSDNGLTQSYALADWWHLTHTCVASGPYSPELTMNDYLSWQAFSHPGVIPLVLKTMILSYPDLFGDNTEEDFYTENYLRHKAFFDSVYRYKPYTIDEINALMFEKVSTPEHQVSDPNTMVLSDMLSAALLDTNATLNQKMRLSLRRNDLTTGWTPRHTIYITASQKDEYVPYSNALALVGLAPDKVRVLDTDNMPHEFSCLMWLGQLFAGMFAGVLD